MGERLTRKAFVEGYAKRSGLPAKYATLGFLDVAGSVLVALPCACEDESCGGWAMVSADQVNSHLELYAPEPIASMVRDLANAISPVEEEGR